MTVKIPRGSSVLKFTQTDRGPEEPKPTAFFVHGNSLLRHGGVTVKFGVARKKKKGVTEATRHPGWDSVSSRGMLSVKNNIGF